MTIHMFTSGLRPNNFFENPYNKLSAFHRPIGSGAVYASDTDPNTIYWKRGSNPNVNSTNGWGVQVVVCDPSYPPVTVTWTGSTGKASMFPVTLRLPPGWTSGKGTLDNVVVAFDLEAGVTHDFYHWEDAGPRAHIHNVTPLDGFGHGPVPGGGQSWSCSASGLWGVAGIIRGFELNNPGTPIYHAHQIALSSKTTNPTPPQLGQGVVWPSINHDGSCNTNPAVWCTGYIPYGALFALPSFINISVLSLSEAGVRLATALQDYGVYCVDNSEGPAMRADQYVNASIRTALLSDLGKIYPLMRRVLNNAKDQTASGGGTPRSINTAFDA